MSQYPMSENPAGPPPRGMYEVAPPATVTGENPVGKAALVVGIFLILVQIMGQAMLHVIGVAAFGFFGLGASVLGLLAAVLGIIGLQKRGAAKGAAGVGFGIGAYVVVMSVANLVTGALLGHL